MQVRRAYSYDDQNVAELINSEEFFFKKHFGDFRFDELIETSFISVVASDSDDYILGFASFTLAPELVKPNSDTEWFEWLNENTDHEFHAIDSLCISLLATEPLHSDEALYEILLSVSVTLPRIDHFLFCLPKSASQRFKHELFETIYEDSDHAVWCVSRKSVLPNLNVRVGREEDHDDLTPLLSMKDPMIFSQNGEYFLAELLKKQNDNNKVLIGKVHEEFYGLMCMRYNGADLSTLRKNFETDHLEGISSGEGVRITLFYIKEEFECRALDMIKSAFAHFPEKEFLYITVPRTESDVPLLKEFISLRPRTHSETKDVLYVISRHSVLEQPQVCLTSLEEKEVSEISEFVDTQIEISDELLESLLEMHKEGEVSILTLKLKSRIIGVLVTKTDIMETGLRNSFLCDTTIDFDKQSSFRSRRSKTPRSSCLVKYMVIEPAFKQFIRFFIRETLRILHEHVMFYGWNPGSIDQDLMQQMVYAPPRHEVKKVEGTNDEFSGIYVTSMRYLSDEKVEINTKILVIGASLTGLSFINFLQKVDSLIFSNIFLISPSTSLVPEEDCHSLRPDYFNFHEKEWRKITELEGINTVSAKLKDIDRKNSTIKCTDGRQFNYDFLILTSGRQFTIPRIKERPDTGLYYLNDIKDSDRISKKVCESDTAENIIIYGPGIIPIATFAGMVEMGINPSRIHIVLPKKSNKSVSWFYDELDAKLRKIIESSGAVIYQGWIIKNIQQNDNNTLKEVQFMDSTDQSLHSISASIMVYCYKRKIDPNLLKTIHRESLAFDKQLIIEPNFQTTDPKIYAAGPVSKFSRRFGPSEPFDKFNTREIGESLAKHVLGSIGASNYITPDTDSTQLPQFRQSVSVVLDLPNQNSLFISNLPSWRHDKDNTAQKTTVKESRYTSIFVDEKDVISCVAYLGTDDEVDFGKLKTIVGMPWTFFNDLVGRHEEGLIEDFIDFFNEKWASVIFYDKFQDLREKLNNVIMDDQLDKMLTQAAAQSLDSNGQIKLRKIIRKRVHPSLWKKVEREIIVFLRDNQAYLPQVYLLPQVDGNTN